MEHEVAGALLKSDVFFIVTTIAVAVVTVFMLIILYYLATILRDIRSISKTTKEEAEHLAEDIEALRTGERGRIIRIIGKAVRFMTAVLRGTGGRRKRKKQ